MSYIVLDIETANQPIDWQDHAALGISWAVCYFSWEDRYHHYRGELGLRAMLGRLEQADLLVGWNSIGFDVPLLKATANRLEVPWRDCIDGIPHCDLMLLCQMMTGQKLSLGEIALWTLGQSKIGSGSHAPELARQGLWDELASYCEHDVWLTKRLFEFAKRNGYLLAEGNQRIGIQVPGGVPACMPEGQPATDKQLRYLADLQQRAGYPVRLQGLTKGQARAEIERLRQVRP